MEGAYSLRKINKGCLNVDTSAALSNIEISERARSFGELDLSSVPTTHRQVKPSRRARTHVWISYAVCLTAKLLQRVGKNEH